MKNMLAVHRQHIRLMIEELETYDEAVAHLQAALFLLEDEEDDEDGEEN